MLTTDKAILRRAKRRDTAARWLITFGGVAVIASVIAIVLLIVGVTLPLFQGARAELRGKTPVPPAMKAEDVLAVGVQRRPGQDSAPLAAHLIAKSGEVLLVELPTGRVLTQTTITSPGGPKGNMIRAAARNGGSTYSLLWADGSVSLVEITSAGVKRTAHAPAEKGPLPVAAIIRSGAGEPNTLTCVRELPDGRLSVLRRTTTVNELTDAEQTTEHRELLADLPGPIGAMTMTGDGGTLYIGTTDGLLVTWKFKPDGKIAHHEVTTAFRDRRAITALAMVLGDVSLAVGDATGELTTWFEVGEKPPKKLRLVHRLAAHQQPVREIVASGRNKSLVSLGAGGGVHLDYSTNERRLLALAADDPLRTIGISERGDALVGLAGDGNMVAWQVHNPHPEVSGQALFGRVLYEGYSEPAWVWQTTGGDDFEPKLSLVPLLFGTLKGTFYAMLLAVPLALAGAIYTSYFSSPRLKSLIKPTVEVMAAVPSVVLGFLVALWLAPLAERWVLAFFLSFATVPAVFVAFMAVWQLLRRNDRAKRVEHGYEFLVLVPVLAAGVGLAAALAGPVETALFAGKFKLWLFQHLDLRYDQRNCIIIAFGLGFAVIPILFSIAEDSLSAVPRSLTAASMAMAASRWQTLWRVVLPSASPGIFAAIMIGFGRAVGETMIVLMATGNTPILDLSPFNGMRTLSANIAVEIPEAPVGGTLYRVLFLCAVLLFTLTFLLNTAAELVRTRLRKKYGQF